MHMLRCMHMKRTSILIPDDLKRRAERYAREHEMSLAALVRSALQDKIRPTVPARDPIFSDDVVFEGETPPDLSARHEDYLVEVYEEEHGG